MPFPRTPEQARFERHIERIPMAGCWLWTGGLMGRGYGQFKVHYNANRLAHRSSWEIHNGPIPDGLFVLHRCDVPLCVNPAHLFLGTQADNMRDMIAKDRKVWSAPKTHCKSGHEFTKENTFKKENGTKGCRQCRADRYVAYRIRNIDSVRKRERERARRVRKEAKWLSA